MLARFRNRNPKQPAAKPVSKLLEPTVSSRLKARSSSVSSVAPEQQRPASATSQRGPALSRPPSRTQSLNGAPAVDKYVTVEIPQGLVLKPASKFEVLICQRPPVQGIDSVAEKPAFLSINNKLALNARIGTAAGGIASSMPAYDHFLPTWSPESFGRFFEDAFQGLAESPKHCVIPFHGCSGAGKTLAIRSSLFPLIVEKFHNANVVLFLSIIEGRMENKTIVPYDLLSMEFDCAQRLNHDCDARTAIRLLPHEIDQLPAFLTIANNRKLPDQSTVANPGQAAAKLKLKGDQVQYASSRSETVILIDILHCDWRYLDLAEKGWRESQGTVYGPANHMVDTPTNIWGSIVICDGPGFERPSKGKTADDTKVGIWANQRGEAYPKPFYMAKVGGCYQATLEKVCSTPSLGLVFKYLVLQPTIYLIVMVVPSLEREAAGRSCHVLATLKNAGVMPKAPNPSRDARLAPGLRNYIKLLTDQRDRLRERVRYQEAMQFITNGLARFPDDEPIHQSDLSGLDISEDANESSSFHIQALRPKRSMMPLPTEGGSASMQFTDIDSRLFILEDRDISMPRMSKKQA